MITQMTTQMLASMQGRGGKGSAGCAGQMARAVADAMPLQRSATWTVEIHSAKFTTEEIKQLIAFYKDARGEEGGEAPLPEIRARSARRWVRSSRSACRCR